MNILDQFQTDRLKASDIPPGREFTVIVEKVVLESLDEGEPDKPVCHFSNAKKSLPLNKTNALQIAEAYGPETDAWPGRPIVLYKARTMFGGKMVDCIRCRVPGDSNAPDHPSHHSPDPNPETNSLDPAASQPGDNIPF